MITAYIIELAHPHDTPPPSPRDIAKHLAHADLPYVNEIHVIDAREKLTEPGAYRAMPDLPDQPAGTIE